MAYEQYFLLIHEQIKETNKLLETLIERLEPNIEVEEEEEKIKRKEE